MIQSVFCFSSFPSASLLSPCQTFFYFETQCFTPFTFSPPVKIRKVLMGSYTIRWTSFCFVCYFQHICFFFFFSISVFYCSLYFPKPHPPTCKDKLSHWSLDWTCWNKISYSLNPNETSPPHSSLESSRFVIAFLPRSKCLNFMAMSLSAMILEPKNTKSATVS